MARTSIQGTLLRMALALFVCISIGFLQTVTAQEETTKDVEKMVSLKKITICEKIENRDPVNPGEEFPVGIGTIACHTVISCKMDSQVIHHLWYKDGELMATVNLTVGNSMSWRTWSTKNLMPGFEGDWEVIVKTSEGEELGKTSFKIK